MDNFTDRETKIIQIMLTVLNPIPAMKDQPQDVKEQLIKEALRIRKMPFNEPELVEIINGITKESQLTVKMLFGFLQDKKIDWKSIDFKSIFQGKK